MRETSEPKISNLSLDAILRYVQNCKKCSMKARCTMYTMAKDTLLEAGYTEEQIDGKAV